MIVQYQIRLICRCVMLLSILLLSGCVCRTGKPQHGASQCIPDTYTTSEIFAMINSYEGDCVTSTSGKKANTSRRRQMNSISMKELDTIQLYSNRSSCQTVLSRPLFEWSVPLILNQQKLTASRKAGMSYLVDFYGWTGSKTTLVRLLFRWRLDKETLVSVDLVKIDADGVKSQRLLKGALPNGFSHRRFITSLSTE